MNKQLSAISFAGITPDTLGGYLCGLGLLSACAQLAPSVRGCWRDSGFSLIGNQLAEEVLAQYLLMNWNGPIYERIWAEELEQDRALARKSRMPHHLASLRSMVPSIQLAAMDSNVIASMRPIPNPVFGDSAGKVGAQRDFSKVLLGCMGFINAGRSKPVSTVGIAKNLATQIRELGRRTDRKLIIEQWLDQTLHATVGADLPVLGSTGTWFPFANKTFNSGQDGFFREGRLSPWSFLLALEGALLLRGEVGRRLSAIARPYAAFPFISEAPNPVSESNVGLKRAGMFWAPIWDTPATLTEVRALLKRGSARMGKRTATAAHEFAVAALGVGVDAGVVRFVPFELRETTSSQVFEAMPMPHILVRSDARSHRAAEIISSLVPWIARLHEPTPGKKKGKFYGLRGPIEQAIIAVSERPEDASCWQDLLLILAQVQKRIDWDSTRGWRQRSASFPRLSPAWLDFAWPEGRPPEVEIAAAIASVGGGTHYPLACNIYGLKSGKEGFWFPKDRPLSAVWYEHDLVDALCDILHRRLVDHSGRKKSERCAPWPLVAKYAVSLDVLDQFLNGGVDDAEIARWLPALSLLDWHRSISNRDDQAHSWSGLLALDNFFRPLLTADLRWKDSSRDKTVEPDTTAALRLTGLLRQEDIGTALDFAAARYRALDTQPISIANPDSITAQRLLAALLIPISRRSILTGRARWTLNTAD